VIVDADSTSKPNTSFAETPVVQPVRVVLVALCAVVSVGFADAVIVFAFVGIAAFDFHISNTAEPEISEIIFHSVIVPE
jgi:hypothetical protein